MNPTRSLGWITLVPFVFLLAGCLSPQQHLLDSDMKASQAQLRSIQTRTFDTADRMRTLRTVMATLQDLSFVIDEADSFLGSVSATKLDYYAMRITVTVRPQSDSRLLVRANCQYGLKPVHDPEPYQHFFAALEKAMFLDRSPDEGRTGAGAGELKPEARSTMHPEQQVPVQRQAAKPVPAEVVDLRQRIKELEARLEEESRAERRTERTEKLSIDEHNSRVLADTEMNWKD